jgi:hypothetical protein
VREQVLVGGRRVVSSSTGSSSLASLLDIKRYKAYSAAIDQALALPPNESIDILLALKRQEE